ncbi:MAG: hypothetical protein SGJ27_14340 [Candidatus Melainabacteria bacterium]|nr:hypothetical protein [Candidatus Melainabacteria bacterium]
MHSDDAPKLSSSESGGFNANSSGASDSQAEPGDQSKSSDPSLETDAESDVSNTNSKTEHDSDAADTDVTTVDDSDLSSWAGEIDGSPVLDTGTTGGIGKLVVSADKKLDFIDDEMAKSLAEYGKKYGDGNRKLVMFACLFGGLVLGFLPPLFGVNLWPLFLTFVALSTAYATVLGLQVMDAYAKHDYRTTSRLLSHALWWNAFCAPFTYFTFFSCSQIQSRLLLVQGRYTEMEALLLISRAANERKVSIDGVPKHFVIANDLACTYIAQHRYSEAAELLKHVLNSKTSEAIKQYAKLNLALCYVKTDLVEEFAKVLDEGEKGLAKAPESLRLRVTLVRSLIDLKSKRYDDAEIKLENTIARARKLKESDELLGICYLNLGELRWKQDRIEESDLYFRTGVDLFKANTEPSYWSLAEGLRSYAEMLQATGQEAECARRLREAELYESAYLEREMMRLTYLRYKVTQEKPVRMLTDLVNVDGFPPLSIELNPPDADGFAQKEEVDLDEVEIEAQKLEALEMEERKNEAAARKNDTAEPKNDTAAPESETALPENLSERAEEK